MDTKLQDDKFSSEVAEATSGWHLPEDESENVRHSPFENIWLRVMCWLFMLSGLFAFALVSKLVENDVSQFVAVSQSLVLILISQASLIYLYRKISNHVDIGTGRTRLQAKVPEEATLPIQIEIKRHGSLIGRDEGFMWLKEGTWYFKGLLTAMRLNQEDVVPIDNWPTKIQPEPAKNKPPKTLPLVSNTGSLELVVNVINPNEDFAKRKRVKQFYRELYNWLVQKPSGNMETLLPPMSVHPSLIRKGVTRIEGVIAGMIMVGFNSAILMGLSKRVDLAGNNSFWPIVSVIVGVQIFAGFWLAWLESRDIGVRARIEDQNLN